jgi:hypothetical protein
MPSPPPPGADAAVHSPDLREKTWRRAQDFGGVGNDATYLWPRWLVLRAVGLVYLLVFAGIIVEGQVLVGPHGLIPLANSFAGLHARFPSALVAFLQAPSLFWLGTGAGMISAVAWLGLIAALAVVLNLWPRLALFACWLLHLSFVTAWGLWSGSQVDQLMLEVALLCIPFAPAGLRPGLGAASPPRPLALFMMRWLLFRVMFENGVIKVIGDARWRDLTAMDALYETSPFPTILGYLDHQLPHGYHLFEVALTYAAEFLAPLLAVCAGRRGRWTAFVIWVVFQAGIQLTNNFGWLNTASIALGLLLLDDQMVVAAAVKLRLRRLGGWLAARAVKLSAPVLAPWQRRTLGTALWTHFALTIVVFGLLCGGAVEGFPAGIGEAVRFPIEGFRSVNSFTLFGGLLPARFAIEFEGSNDGGVTWRPYEFFYQPQRVDRICPYIAPWYPRFEATLQIEATRSTPSPLYALVATHLLQGDAAVAGLFARNPFPGRPPAIVRMPAYRLTFTDRATQRTTGAYWHKELVGEYLPMMSLDAHGQGVAVQSPLDAVRLMAGQGNVAAQAGLGLMYAQGDGVPRDEVEALVWFTLAARAGDPDAARNRDLAESRVGPAGVQAARQRSEAIAAEIDARKKIR